MPLFFVLWLNTAPTVLSALSVTVHVAVPVHAPVHPPNDEPVAAAAVSVTVVPPAKLAEQVVPQLMPAGLLVTVPEPLPDNCTASWNDVAVARAKLAVTLVFAVSVSAQVEVPLHAPDQPVNVDPVAGVAVSVTAVPLAKLALHVWPQSMPPGALLTLPDPVPAF
jgi:hypothetical protein